MKTSLFVASSLILSLAACGQPQEAPARSGEMMAGADEMPMAGAGGMTTMPMAGQTGAMTGMGTGVVTAVDVAAGSITIDHGPISAVGWPAMAMTFTAAPTVLESVSVGDRVSFDVSVNGSVNEVTAVRPE